jgi:signal recognition particle subunit SRP54
MIFESLSDRLQETFRKLKGRGRLSEKDVDEALREIKLALLEADVNFKVVKEFIGKVRERSVGQDVLRSLTPGQMVVKIVHQELTALMGNEESKLRLDRQPSVIMLVGLQGAGKTSTAGKLGQLLKRQGRRPLLIAADVYRPAAIRQLEILGEKLELPVFSIPGNTNPVEIAEAGVAKALSLNRDVVIVDTAGRLHINEELMTELTRIKETVKPSEILLVVDAMTGQDAVNVAESFHKQLTLSGLILTKMDSDTRGGAALSIRSATGCPIKFVGLGEKLEDLEVFHPERMSSRILGMGDVLSLIERAEAAVDVADAQKMMAKLQRAEFTLEDFMAQMEQMKKLGPLEQILGMLPGVGKQLKNIQIDEKQMKRVEAIILSMTKEERRHPQIINASRKKRIAAGSGMAIQDVNRLLTQFEQTRKMMKQFAEMGKGKLPRLPFRP